MYKRNIIFVSILLIIFTIISVCYFGRLIDTRMSSYVTEEVTKVSKVLIRKILNDDFFDGLDLKELFVVNKNDSGEIELIDFNTANVNSVLGKINDEILYYFNEFDNGNTKFIKKYSNIFDNYEIESRKGLYINVPLGIIFSNQFIFGAGPKIPIGIILSGQVESNIDTSIKQYGINNVLLEINVKVRVDEKIIFPFSNKYIKVDLKIPLVIELISGKVPEYYLNGQNSDIIKKN